MPNYPKGLIEELHAPLFAVHAGLISGTGGVATVLLCETLLSLLPKMSLKDKPYHLLRHYHITPIESGVIGQLNRICLRGSAVLRGGILFVPTATVHRVFIPFKCLPATGRRQVIRMLKFLDTIKSRNIATISNKSAEVLVDEYVECLLECQVISTKKVLKSPLALVRAGCAVTSVVKATDYCKLAFNHRHLHASSRLKSFLQLAIDLTSEEEVFSSTAKVMVERYKFVPKVAVQGNTPTIFATSFLALSTHSVVETLRFAMTTGTLPVAYSCGFLCGVEANLVSTLNLPADVAMTITR